MRGLSLNSTGVQHRSCFERNDALEFLSHNGKSRGQSAVPFSNRRISHNIVSRQRLSFQRSKIFDPLCIKSKFPQCSGRKILCCRAYGSPPDIPVREDHVLSDGEAEEEANSEKPDLVSETSEATPPDVVASITSWGTLPPRFKLILTTALAFVICNMDKVSCHFLTLPLITLVLLDVRLISYADSIYNFGSLMTSVMIVRILRKMLATVQRDA